MHLVSTVTGHLADGKTALDAVTACFPAGTLSGAPKVRAMELIEEVEKTRRGLYGGVLGYLDFAGNADFAIAIRTALMRDGTAYVQAGGGVVADSNGPYEYNEAANKARAVLNAIAAAETLTGAMTAAAPHAIAQLLLVLAAAGAVGGVADAVGRRHLVRRSRAAEVDDAERRDLVDGAGAAGAAAARRGAVAALAVRGWVLRLLGVLVAAAERGMGYLGIGLWVIRDVAVRAADLAADARDRADRTRSGTTGARC